MHWHKKIFPHCQAAVVEAATSASASSTGARDKREQAQEHLTTATAMYREMDMRFWLDQAEAELKVLR